MTYEELMYRYSNSIKFIDSYGLKGIILFNEPIDQVRKMWLKYKFSKYSLIEKKNKIIEAPILEFPSILEKSNKLPRIIGRKKITINQDVYRINIIDFVKFAITKGYDWRLFGQPEWEAIEPKKKKKFIKPKTRKI